MFSKNFTSAKGATYVCGLCRKKSVLVLYRKLEWQQKTDTAGRAFAYHAVRKIGQSPPPSIEIPAELQTRLGTSAGHYKNGLTCRSLNLGIAAVAYMVRAVEG